MENEKYYTRAENNNLLSKIVYLTLITLSQNS